MKKKVWNITVKDKPNKVDMVKGENDEFYTTDTEAYLMFNLQDKFFSPRTATLTLENRNDGSLKSEEVEVVDGVIEWEMPRRYIEHFGNWQGQLVYEDTKDGQPELYTSAPFTFVVNAHIGDEKKPGLVEIENWEKFIREGTELIEAWEDLEALREENERQRQANYQELLDTGVLQTNINTKLEQLEEEYAPKLTEVTAQLAQTENYVGNYEGIVFEKYNDFSSNYFRVPAAERLNDGSIIAFSQIQYGGISDYAHQDIGYAKSYDNGRTWTDKKIVSSAKSESSRVLNPTTIYDSDTNTIILFVTELFNNDSIVWWSLPDDMWDMYTYISTDNGDTWSKKSIKSDVINSRSGDWGTTMAGLGTGIKMKDGKYVVAIETGYFDVEDNMQRIGNGLLYSDDLESWTLSESLTPEIGDEANIVLLDDNTILLNARNYGTRPTKRRKMFVTSDLGKTWNPHKTHNTVVEERATMGHTLAIEIEGKTYIIFSHIQSGVENVRQDLGLSVLEDTGDAWREVGGVYKERTDGYSCLVFNKNHPNELYILYEKESGRIFCKNISNMIPTIKSLSVGDYETFNFFKMTFCFL